MTIFDSWSGLKKLKKIGSLSMKVVLSNWFLKHLLVSRLTIKWLNQKKFCETVTETVTETVAETVAETVTFDPSTHAKCDYKDPNGVICGKICKKRGLNTHKSSHARNANK